LSLISITYILNLNFLSYDVELSGFGTNINSFLKGKKLIETSLGFAL